MDQNWKGTGWASFMQGKSHLSEHDRSTKHQDAWRVPAETRQARCRH